MKTSTTTSFDLFSGDLRMDASYHASSGQYSNSILKFSKLHTDRLDQVCIPGGIFVPGRFRRVYVDNPENGLRWLSPTEMQKADLSGLGYISKKYTSNLDSLRLHKGWTLISRSGTIGNITYVRDEMDGLIGSDDIIRIIANPDQISSGYLYIVLSSPPILNLIKQKTYGAVISHIEAHHIIDLPIPRLDTVREEKINILVKESVNHWNKAVESIQKARSFFDYLQTKNVLNYQPHDYDVSMVNFSTLDGRLGAHYHSKIYRDLESSILSNNHVLLKDACKKIFAPPPFKHIYLPAPNKYPFLTGGELRNRQYSEIRYLSPLGMKDINDYVVQKNWLALYKSGSLDSIFASVFMINDDLDGFCLSDHVIRLVVSSEAISPEYIYAFLSTWAGRLLIVRRATGMAVPFVREDSVSTIPIPILEKKFIQEITTHIRDALIYRAQSLEFEDQAQKLLADGLSM